MNDNDTTGWYNPPSYTETHELWLRVGRLRAADLRISRTIQETEDELKSEFARKPELRRARMKELLDQQTDIRAELAELESLMDFYRLHKTMYEVYSRKGIGR